MVVRRFAVLVSVLTLGCASAPRPHPTGGPAHAMTSVIEADAPSRAPTVTASRTEEVPAPDDERAESTPRSPEPETDPPAEAWEAPWDPDAPVRFAPEVEAEVRRIAARVPRRRADAFIKVGDSATVSRIFLQCFADDGELALDGRDDLRSTIARFRRVSGDPFRRESEAAGVGWSANRPLRGSPTPLALEVRALNPRWALVMFGGNDLELGRPERYARRMRALVDRLVGWGVVPVLSTIPARNDDPEADAEVPVYNEAIRALAAERRLPLLDLSRALAELPDRGLASDGVHPSAPVVDGRAHGCDFTAAGLRHGMNVRNLLTLRVLERLVDVLAEGEGAAPEGP